jgi:tRNA(Phe) wybutosine-synthesizing methylase Tyw3
MTAATAASTPPAAVPLHEQKLAILRADEYLNEVSTALIAQNKTTREKLARLRRALEAAMQTLDDAGSGIDVRPDLLKKGHLL